ncbi:MAG: flavin reductase family protein [Firmicutes bacterium]|jgi:flavin reductase (DIM6/NTAB) family NADH-FMN oxidoreductase RutF|nr:flavin reductase family protein [Bacillota bacterium]
MIERKSDRVPKLRWNPGTVLCPCPVVMVTCQCEDSKPNIVTVAWIGTICSDPPMLSISVRPERHSHRLITESGEFVVNVPTLDLTRATDYCGVVSGKEVDKFERTGLTAAPAVVVRPPVIQECPLNIECRVARTLDLGSHTMFLAEVVAVQAEASLMTAEGRLAFERAGLIAYAHGHYYALGKTLGHFGYSVRKRPATRARTRR